MDPQVCFVRILDAIADDDREEAFYACNDMIEWLNKGGFYPVAKRNYTQHSLTQPVPLAFFRNLRSVLKRSQG